MSRARTLCVAVFSASLGALPQWGLSGAGSIGTAMAIQPAAPPESLPYPLEASLLRFELQPGVEPTFRDWMQFLRDEHPAVLETLDRERMYVEGIFRDPAREPRVIYWLVVRGTGGASSDTSEHPVDRKHVEFMGRVLRKGSRSQLSTENWLLAPFIAKAIAEEQRVGQ